MPAISLVHLAGPSLGLEPLQRFAAGLREHPPGVEHELVVAFNGREGAARIELEGALEGIGHRAVHLEHRLIDLAAYPRLIADCQGELVCLTNAYARPLSDGWLAKLAAAAREPSAGMVGATGSWESAFSSAPIELRLRRFVQFPRFPNPHLRTNGVLARRDLWLSLDWGRVTEKIHAHCLEGGRASLSRQIVRQGLRTLVVGRDGRAFDPPDWPASATFRSGGQRNLLLADNRTDQYAEADDARRRELERMAWGRRTDSPRQRERSVVLGRGA